jgi:hypothetical protein
MPDALFFLQCNDPKTRLLVTALQIKSATFDPHFGLTEVVICYFQILDYLIEISNCDGL